jgi:hypothetical protein
MNSELNQSLMIIGKRRLSDVLEEDKSKECGHLGCGK